MSFFCLLAFDEFVKRKKILGYVTTCRISKNSTNKRGSKYRFFFLQFNNSFRDSIEDKRTFSILLINKNDNAKRA